MNQMNEPQRAAVRYVDGPLLVLAGAGSGKTRVITQKIVHLIRHHGRQARHICAVTFTNKAAKEMKERVGQLLQGREGYGLKVSTFHTLGLTILKKELKAAGLKPGFSIFDASDSGTLLRELLRKELGDSLGAEDDLRWKISRWKNDFIDPASALSHAEDESEALAARMYEAYDRCLRAYNAVDFDDLILLPVRLLKGDPELLERWQNQIRYLLVDEYQDTNACQYELMRLLVGVTGGLTAVGDDDQSIYAWRGARPENLAQLKTDYPALKVIKLEQNYRSMGTILHAANTLIANNPHLFDKKLWSAMGPGDPIRVISCRDADGEMERVVSELLTHKFQSNTQYHDYAVLYRGNHQSRALEKVLRAHRIPYKLSGGTSFFERTEIKDLVAYLRVLVNPDDDNAFLRIVNTPRREIGPGTLEKLGSYANERGVSLHAASFELGLEHILSPRAHERVSRFTRWLTEMSDRAKRGDPVGLVKDVIRDIGYEAWLEENAPNPSAAERRVANVNDLIEWLIKVRDEEEGAERSLADLVARMTLLGILERDSGEDDENAVHLMTLHASKGLEFDHVFIVGMEEELLPHRTSLEEDNVEEERRLAYVGITRARRTLTFTLARKRKRYGEVIECEPSRFLSELPKDALEWEGAGVEVAPEVRKQRGNAHLANLKGMFD
ncbi:DNA helicase Rep [Endothiovibrio diazotrophicus]